MTKRQKVVTCYRIDGTGLILRSPRPGERAFGSMVMHREDDEDAPMTPEQKQVILDFTAGTAGKYLLIPIEDPGAR